MIIIIIFFFFKSCIWIWYWDILYRPKPFGPTFFTILFYIRQKKQRHKALTRREGEQMNRIFIFEHRKFIQKLNIAVFRQFCTLPETLLLLEKLSLCLKY